MSAFNRIKYQRIEYPISGRKTPLEIPVVTHDEAEDHPNDVHMDAIAALVLTMNHMKNKVTRMERALEKNLGIKPWP